MRRRALLTCAGLALSTSLSGCLDVDGATRPESNTNTPTQTPPEYETTTKTDHSERRAACEDAPENRGPDRGQSDVELDVHDVEDDENVEYLPKEHEVRYVAAHRYPSREEAEEAREQGETPEREPQYDTTPADRWGKQRCRSAAVKAAAEHVQEELDTENISGGVTSGLTKDNEGVTVNTRTTLDRECDVVYDTDVDYEDLVAATPQTVSASYEMDGFEYEMDVPVFARHTVERLS